MDGPTSASTSSASGASPTPTPSTCSAASRPPSSRPATTPTDRRTRSLIVEHDPVFTLGASGDAANVLVSEAALAARGATFARTDRGGDVTFHGPGQTRGVPDPRPQPPRSRPRASRSATCTATSARSKTPSSTTCAGVGVAAGRVPGRTGVWVGPDARGPERKVCAMGIRCSRWVTMHGLALNVTTDLSWFDLVVPCGIADRGVTSLAREDGPPARRGRRRGRARLPRRARRRCGAEGPCGRPLRTRAVASRRCPPCEP